ncbi:MAG: hypothetical protein WCC53_04355 [Thermoanaerobaculia bacterium]|jgi:hypothetical protein
MQKSHFRLWALLGGGVILVLALAGFWKVQSAPVDTSLTPAHLAPPLSSVADRFEVLVGGVPLEKAIADKRLLLAGENGASPLVVPDAAVRINEAERVRAARVPSLLALSAIAGGGFVLFLIGLFAPLIGAFKQHGLIDMHLESL